jgi:hypothetical protein
MQSTLHLSNSRELVFTPIQTTRNKLMAQRDLISVLRATAIQCIAVTVADMDQRASQK